MTYELRSYTRQVFSIKLTDRTLTYCQCFVSFTVLKGVGNLLCGRCALEGEIEDGRNG